ncbi:MAG: glycosyltransferase family 2 protein [Elusimicrobiota bacterium]
MEPRLTVVIPAFNDQAGLDVLLPRLQDVLREMNVPSEILVVDDGSVEPIVGRGVRSDSAFRIIRHRRNQGYGAALKTGIRAAEGAYVLIMDADNQHNPDDIPRFFARAQGCDMVVGLRRSQRSSPMWRRPGKMFLTWLLNSMSPIPVPDINCGFRCIRREAILRHLDLCSNAFSFSVSSTVLMLNRGHDVRFEEVDVRERIGTSSVRMRTGLQTIILIIRLVVYTTPLRFFLPISFVLVLLGIAWTTPYALMGRGISVGGLFLLVTGMLTFFFGIIADQLSELIKRDAR